MHANQSGGRPRWRLVAVAGAAGMLAAAAITVAMPAAFADSLLTDNFEDGNSSGWSTSGGSWAVATDGTRVYRQSGQSSDARTLTGTTSWSDYAVQARVKPTGFNGANRHVGVIARAQSSSRYYAFVVTSSGGVQLVKRDGSAPVALAGGSGAVPANTWATLRLEATGSTLRGYVNGSLSVQATDSVLASGRVGLAASYASASFDDVEVATVTGTPPTGGPTTGPTLPPTGPPLDPGAPPVGFASVNALGQNGTTGGAGGPTVTVSNATDLLTAISQPGPLNIRVNGMIALPGPMHDVMSDKTIVGVGANSGITGGGLNIGLPVSDATSPPANAIHNVIVRNLNFRNTVDDAINVQMFSHHVWIDHNDLSAGYDGLIDVKRGASYVTVSWNHTHHHTKNMLLGHDDSNAAQDTGYLKVTYHHNWFDRTPQRNPRVRFGDPVHVFNNYFVYNTDVGVACQMNSGCVVEGNYFEDVEVPWSISYAGDRGRLVARNNVLAGTSEPGDSGGSVTEPSSYYSYTVADPNGIRATVMTGSGTGKLPF
ncbi:polysaccharide lyase family 1 protein [Plantactinospora sp. KLBMP9567]|uniref:pectate lyase family protein n=1 Tax=Plantactinospora sp. KLBMP9567 TaxID=3085900 RepID=UPI002980DC0D|nr:family 16 glycoside hydrolase [Plantactinospora sp. KLBMP9567]MDW5325447.1 pectate lyase [Plantactinospora sp. KLBMP9567]